MKHIYKITTLNINRITSDTKIGMLATVLRQKEIDIAMIQEVTTHKLNTIPGYTSYINEGSERRGTAIILKEGLQSTHIKKLPTGRGIAANTENTWFINIYAPSGTARKTEREDFFNTSITHLIPEAPTELILAGDFNCTTTKTDTTGPLNNSAALNKLTKSLRLIDAWTPTTTREGYTHYTQQGASRIDRIYTTTTTMSRKTGIITQIAAFTDHHAVILRLALDHPLQIRGRGLWKMNLSLLQDKNFADVLKTKWNVWKTHMKYYPSVVV
jgi:exonuclease III